MSVARLLLIADGFASGGEASGEWAVAAVRAGAAWVQLRDHDADVATFSERARRMAERLRQARPDVVISVNTHAEVAAELGAGLHVGSRGPSVEEARRMAGIELISAAVHDPAEAAAATEAGADALVFSPVFRTASKPGHPGAGLDALAETCRAAGRTPVLAMGGMRPEEVRECMAAGAHGVAVLSLVRDASSAIVPVIVCAFIYALELQDQ